MHLLKITIHAITHAGASTDNKSEDSGSHTRYQNKDTGCLRKVNQDGDGNTAIIIH